MKKLFHYIQTHPHRTQALLGIEYEQLVSLIVQLQHQEAEQLVKMNRDKVRINAPGAGRPL